jgi:lantibiotic protection ABC transporter MutE/EpiE family permease subunit
MHMNDPDLAGAPPGSPIRDRSAGPAATRTRGTTGGTATGPTDSPSIATLVSTELIRMRSGFLGWYILLSPIVIAIPLYLGSIFSPEGRTGRLWDTFSNVTLEFWGVLIPMTAGLIAALAVRADTEPWRFLLSYAIPRRRYFTAKVAALALAQLLSATILAVLLTGGALLTGQLAHAAPMILGAAYLPWAAGLAATALAVLVCTVWGLGPGIALGVAGMMAGALISDKSFWYVIPPAWPMRVILPLAQIHPNGLSLDGSSPLNDTGAIPLAIGLSVAATIVILVIGGRHMSRKEI